MDVFDVGSAQNVFVFANQQSSQLESLAAGAMKSGIDRYMNKDFEGAIKDFKRAVGLFQQSPYAVDAAQYMAGAYLQLDDTEGAIKSYKTAIRLDTRRDDSHVKLGNLYYAEGRNEEATREYEAAAKLNPDATNLYSLGQAYLSTGRYNEAETQFDKVARLAPQDPAGKFGIGQTYSKQGRSEDAIRVFKTAVAMKDDFYDAYAEIGYAYADLGDMDAAQEMVDLLERQDQPELADTLSRYMYRVDPPKIVYAQSAGTFPFLMGSKTPVLTLDAYLATADAAKIFTMKFQFDKAMDRESVENISNWQISRATGSGPGQAYNYGMPIAATEITLCPLPQGVYYDSQALTATVYFKIQQNGTADGTLDPSHIEFKFNGKDVYGLAINSDYDQFTGFSGVA